MTDAQLAILIQQYYQRLITAIRALESELPDDWKRVETNRLIPQLPPSEWYPLTESLHELAAEMKESISNLERPNA